jgi:hypothetical protein
MLAILAAIDRTNRPMVNNHKIFKKQPSFNLARCLRSVLRADLFQTTLIRAE